MAARTITCGKCGRQGVTVTANGTVNGHTQGPFGRKPGTPCPQGNKKEQ